MANWTAQACTMAMVTVAAANAARMAWTGFAWSVERHGIAIREARFPVASEVAASIASSATAR